MNPSFIESALEQTVASVFATMLDLEVTPLPGADWQPEADRVTSVIHITGSNWCGAVGLQTSGTLACELASRYLSIPRPGSVNDDVRDVLGELVNMVAGNVKSALCPGATLSMPSVIDGDRYRLRIGASAVEEREAFLCAGRVFWVFRFTQSA